MRKREELYPNRCGACGDPIITDGTLHTWPGRVGLPERPYDHPAQPVKSEPDTRVGERLMSISQGTIDLNEALAKILPKSQHSKIEKIAELFHPDTVNLVETRRTHVAVESVEVYGLIIGVDANGHAASIEFPYGAEVIA